MTFANYLQACIHRELNRIHSDISSRGAAFMFAPPFSQGSTLEFQEVAVILTLWRPAFSRDAKFPHERYQTSVPEWDRQFRLVRVHHEHREELGRLRLAGIGTDTVAVAGQLGEALSGLVDRHRSVVDLTADRPLKHGRVDEGGFGMRVAGRVAARAIFDEHALDALAGTVRQLVLVDEGHLGVLRLRRIREDATKWQGRDEQRIEDAFHRAPSSDWRMPVQAPARERRSHSSKPMRPRRASPSGTSERSSTRPPKYRAAGSRHDLTRVADGLQIAGDEFVE